MDNLKTPYSDTANIKKPLSVITFCSADLCINSCMFRRAVPQAFGKLREGSHVFSPLYFRGWFSHFSHKEEFWGGCLCKPLARLYTLLFRGGRSFVEDFRSFQRSRAQIAYKYKGMSFCSHTSHVTSWSRGPNFLFSLRPLFAWLNLHVVNNLRRTTHKTRWKIFTVVWADKHFPCISLRGKSTF